MPMKMVNKKDIEVLVALFSYRKNLNIKKINKTNIYIHLLKSHELVLYVIKTQIFIIKLISLIFNQKKFHDQEIKGIDKIFSIIKKVKIIRLDKLEELFYSLLIIHNSRGKNLTNAFKEDKFEDNLIYDVAVIGSGPGGSVTSYYLNNNKFKTILIESGKGYKNSFEKHSSTELLNQWKYGGISSTIGNNFLQYSSGETFGGGSEINSGLINLPDEGFINRLKNKFDIQDISIDQINENLKEIFKIMKIKKYQIKNTNLVNEFLKSNKRKIRIEKLKKFYSLVKNDLKKQSMSKTLLKDYINKKGNYITNDSLKKIKEKKNFYELSLTSGKDLKAKNVFLCMGSPYTSNFLLRNKLIDKKEINYLKFHPMIKIIIKSKKKINLNDNDIMPYQLTEYMPKYIIGHASSNINFIKIALDKHDLEENIEENYEYISIFHITYSLGKANLIKSNLIKEPLYNFNLSQAEIRILIQGIKDACKYFLNNKNIEYVYPLVENTKKIINKKDMRILDNNFKPSSFYLSAVHLLGGLPFGEKNTPLDSFGKLKKQKGIYVNDSSLICDDLLRNPQATVMALTMRNIIKFIRDHKN